MLRKQEKLQILHELLVLLTGLLKEDWPGCTQPTILYAEVRLPTQ